ILGLYEEQHITGFVHGLRTRILVEFLSTDLPTTYKGLMKKTYTWIEAKEVASNGAPNNHRKGFDRFNKGCSWDNNKGKKKNHDRVDSKISLIGFSEEHSWPLKEVPLEVTIGERGKPFNAEHKLHEYKHIEPVKQKKRGLAPELNEATCKEVDKLTKAGIL
nr:reverse transcriptase domain-containing protein [Tanacetum cinerariifolium]